MKKFMWLLIFVVLSSFVSAALIDNIEVYYSFDTGTVSANLIEDQSTNGYDGTNNGCDIDTAGLLNEGLVFVTANSDYVNTTEFFNLGVGSISFWVKKVGGFANDVYFAKNGGGATNGYAQYSNAAGHLDFYASGNTNVANFGVPPTTWIHYVITTDGTNYNHYINGTHQATTPSVVDMFSGAFPFELGRYNGASEYYGGEMDEFGIWSRELTQAEVTELYNSGAGLNPYNADTLQLSDPLPINNSAFNTFPIDINVTVNSTNIFNCSLILNSVVNETTNHLNGTDIFVNYTFSTMIDGEYNYTINCTDGTANSITDQNTFFVDFQPPTITTNFLNNGMYNVGNVTGQFNFSDNDQIHSVNITVNGITIFNTTHLHLPFYSYNFTYDVENVSIGESIVGVRIADGHTADVLGGNYYFSNGLFNDYSEYEFYDGGKIKTKSVMASVFDDWKSEKKYDRYVQKFKPKNKGSSQTFIETSGMPIYIYNSSKYNGNWIVTGNHWKDYVLVGEPESTVIITQIDDFNVKVTIDGIINNQEELIFHSIGDLNIVQNNYSFYRINLSDTFNGIILDSTIFDINLSVDYGLLNASLLGIVPSALLEFNGTNYSSTLLTSDANSSEFRNVFSSAFNAGLSNVNYSHTWFFNFNNLTSGYLNTSPSIQQKLTPAAGVCNATNIYPIINISYFDEISNDPLNITNAFNLNFDAGVTSSNSLGSFVGNHTDTFCGNINSSLTNFNWDLTGTFTLSNTGYITRILEFDAGNVITVSNNPPANESFFIIKTNESSTIIFNWQSYGFQPLDGTIRVFKCNNDGTRSLTESIAVTGGTTGSSSPSLQLLTQAYAYDIIIDGVTYEDTLGYSKCHIETASTVTYFVNIDENDVSQSLGLFSSDCSLTKVSNTSVLMSWGTNPENDDYVSGCVTVYRNTIGGAVNIFDNCSSEIDGYSRTIIVPVDSANTYTVTGHLEQGDFTAVCNDVVAFTVDDIPGGLFGLSGIFATLLLILSLALMYSSDGEIALIASVVGVIVSWIVGITNLPWIYNSALITFLLIIVFVGRYSRKIE